MTKKGRVDREVKRILDAIEADPGAAIDRTVKLAEDVKDGLGMIGKAAEKNPEGLKRALAVEALRIAARLAK